MLARRFPFAFGVSVSAIKTLAADTVAQRLEGRADLDLRRSCIFLLWGAGYLGGVQYFIYSFAFPRVLFPSAAKFVTKPFADRLIDRRGQLDVLKQVALDQFVHHPFVLIPAFYCLKESVESGRWGSEVCRTALAKYAANAADDLKFCWSVWIPSFLFNFSVCPLWARVPFVAVVSFGFTSYFSFLRGGPQQLAAADTASRVRANRSQN